MARKKANREPRREIEQADTAINMAAKMYDLQQQLTRAQATIEQQFRNADIDPLQPVIIEDTHGNVLGVAIQNEGLFPSAWMAGQFAMITNELTAIATGILTAATLGSGRKRDEYMRKQQAELAACYVRFCTFLRSVGDHPEGTEGYRNMRDMVKEIEQGVDHAIETGDFCPLEKLAKNATSAFSAVLFELETITERRRSMNPGNEWLGKAAYEIRDDYKRATGRDQPYLETGDELLTRLDGITAPWVDEIRYNIRLYTHPKTGKPNGTGLKNYLSQNISRYRRKRKGGTVS